MRNLNRSYLRRLFLIAITYNIIFTNNIIANDKIIALINGKTITENALLTEINRKIPLTSYHSQVSEERLKEFREQALQKLIKEELLYQEAKKQKLTIKTEQVDQQIKMMMSGYSSDREFEKELAKTGLNNKALAEKVERHLLIQKIEQKEIIEKVSVTDSDMFEYYNENKEKFIKPEQFRVRHILISVNPGAMAEGWQAGQKQAGQVYSRIMAGESFARLVQEVSADSSSRNQGGDIGWFHKGQLLQQLEQALETMHIGEVCKPIRSIYGYHILKFEDRRPKKQLTYKEIDLESLKKKLMTKRIDMRRQEFIASLKEKADIQIFEH